MSDTTSTPDPKPGEYDHPSTDAAEKANAENTKRWVADQVEQSKSDKK